MNTSNPNEITDSNLLWQELNGHLKLEKHFESKGNTIESELHKNYRFAIVGSIFFHWSQYKKPTL